MKITIGGPAGTGKGTSGRMIADHYGYKFVSGGDLFRRAAAERGMTMEEFDAYAKEHESAWQVDKEIDAVQEKMGKEEDDFVLESRLAWYFVPDSIKIKFDCELDERIRRIASVNSTERIAYAQEDFEVTKEKTLKRFADHQARIRELYGIEDLVADEHFDITIDTTHIPADEVARQAITQIEKLKARSAH